MMMYHLNVVAKSSVDVVETIIFEYMSPHGNPELGVPSS